MIYCWLVQAMVEQVARDHELLRERIVRLGGPAGITRLEAGLAAARAAAQQASDSPPTTSPSLLSSFLHSQLPKSNLLVVQIAVCSARQSQPLHQCDLQSQAFLQMLMAAIAKVPGTCRSHAAQLSYQTSSCSALTAHPSPVLPASCPNCHCCHQ